MRDSLMDCALRYAYLLHATAKTRDRAVQDRSDTQPHWTACARWPREPRQALNVEKLERPRQDPFSGVTPLGEVAIVDPASI